MTTATAIKTYIYGLFDPITGELRYIGRSRNLQRRLYQHSTKPHEAIKGWILSLRREHKTRPEIRILEECEDDGIEQEQAWLRKSFAEGVPILNQRLLEVGLVSTLQVKLQRDVIEDFKDAARREGLTTSEWLLRAGRDRIAAGRPKKDATDQD